MKWILDRIGRLIAAYLQKPAWGYDPFVPAEPTALRASIKPGDILLIEGHNRISGIIEYLTRSTWSHAALYVGPISGTVRIGGEPLELIESNLNDGVVCVPLSKYLQFRTRICRPIGLTSDDCQRVCNYAVERIGLQYDLKNLVDLARYLLPLPFPRRWRRRMIALGSGDPTRLICSALIAQAFGYVGYPILPNISLVNSEHARQEIFHIRDSSLYAPRDFDISPYFAVIKPTIEIGFDYKKLNWAKETVPSRSDGIFNRYELSCT